MKENFLFMLGKGYSEQQDGQRRANEAGGARGEE